LGIGVAEIAVLARLLSHLAAYSCGMNEGLFADSRIEQEETIAVFGEAGLVHVQGKIQLRGGSMADHAEALEWMSLFMPEHIVNLER
jgi:hypothetical protein